MDRNKEDLSFEEQRISELIGTLKQVDAPGNFDVRVRSRIAAGRPAGIRSYWRPLVAGLATAVLIGGAGYLGYQSVSRQPASSMTAATSPQPITAPTMSSPAAVALNAPPAESVTSPNRTASSPVKKGRVDRRADAPSATGGSIDEALKDTQKVGSGAPGRIVTDPQAKADVSVISVLSMIGVDASWNGTGWHVISVKNNSLADRSALRAGDVIDAIDGKPLTNDMKFSGRVTGKSLHIVRDGGPLELSLRP